MTTLEDIKPRFHAPNTPWTAEDYDLIEFLVTRGLRSHEVATYFIPHPSAQAIRCAMSRAGIKGVGAGRPRKKRTFHHVWVRRAIVTPYMNYITPIRIARQVQNLSQAEFGEMLGVSQPHISLIETGQRYVTLEFLREMAHALDRPDLAPPLEEADDGQG